jgi:phospholipid/cholesterol/gamma-HCH transport system ATP-binding protein
MVIVTHELDSIFAVADRSVFLDPDTHTMLAIGSPAELRDHSPDPKIRQFLNRGRL